MPLFATLSLLLAADAAAAAMKMAMGGRVMVNHFRRPSVSIVLIAGRPKTKLTAPFTKP